MKHINQKFKKGATSVYVVVIATLLFSVITVSFIRIIINETNKTTSDELAQSAYDSALAGVEDAKAALKRYYECKATENPDESKCGTATSGLMGAINKGFTAANTEPSGTDSIYCDAVAEALGRGSGSEVLIKEENSSGAQGTDIIAQAYTCVMINNTLDDYRGTLNAGNVSVIPLKTDHPENITGLKISWLMDDDVSFSTLNYKNKDSFISRSEATPTPPTLSAQIIQTAEVFSINEFDSSDASGNTNRGTVILVPTNTATGAVSNNHVAKSVVSSSNDHSYSRTTSNSPQKIYCDTVNNPGEFACTATIELPNPIPRGGSRNKDTFYLVLSLPYADPTTTFSVQMCQDNEPGGTRGDCKGGDNPTAKFVDVQISVDSTGRANDMYSRVEARVEFGDPYFPYPEFAIQATGSDEDSIRKNFYVTQNCFVTKPDGTVGSCDNTGDVPD